MEAKFEFIDVRAWVEIIYEQWSFQKFHLPLIFQHVIEPLSQEEALEQFNFLINKIIELYQAFLNHDDRPTLSGLLNTAADLSKIIIAKGVPFEKIKDYENSFANPTSCETDQSYRNFKMVYCKPDEIKVSAIKNSFNLIELLDELQKIHAQLDDNSQHEFISFFKENTGKILNLYEILDQNILVIFNTGFVKFKEFFGDYTGIPSGYLQDLKHCWKKNNASSLQELPFQLSNIAKKLRIINTLTYCTNVLSGGKIALEVPQLYQFGSLHYTQQMKMVLKDESNNLHDVDVFLDGCLYLSWNNFLQYSVEKMEKELPDKDMFVQKLISVRKAGLRHNNQTAIFSLFAKQDEPIGEAEGEDQRQSKIS